MVLKNLMIPFTLINKRKHNSLKISDYPVFYYKNKSVQQENIKFGVRILFWAGMVGHGKNFKEAFGRLCEKFDLFKKNNEYFISVQDKIKRQVPVGKAYKTNSP